MGDHSLGVLYVIFPSCRICYNTQQIALCVGSLSSTRGWNVCTLSMHARFCAPRRGQGSFLCEVFYARTNVSIPKDMTTLASRTLETLNVRLHRDAFLYVISSNRVEINNFATVDCRSECTLKCSVGGVPVRLKQYSELVLKLGVFFLYCCYTSSTLTDKFSR